MKTRILLTLLTAALLLNACGTTPNNAQNAQQITLGAYTTPREAYGVLIPMFQEQWRAQTGGEVTFETSYLGSGAQSRAIIEGFEADLAALSLEADITRIVNAGLIMHN